MVIEITLMADSGWDEWTGEEHKGSSGMMEIFSIFMRCWFHKRIYLSELIELYTSNLCILCASYVSINKIKLTLSSICLSILRCYIMY